MAQFKAFAPGVEVNGETVLSLVDGMGAFKETGLKILAAHGIADIKPGHWYPQQAWLDAFKDIAGKMGASTLLSIGKTVPANAKWPPHVDSIDKALASISNSQSETSAARRVSGMIGSDQQGASRCHIPSN